MPKILKFPDDFLWGAATSAFQVEGNIFNSDWAKYAKEGRVPKIGAAADHYHRYDEDFELAKKLGHNAHRFSIEWSRIEPEEGKFDEKEIEHYRNVLQALRKRGITPFVTLWHFSLPLWFSESGGFERKDAPEVFARYGAYVVKQLGDLCEHFATLNEPNVYATHGYIYGVWPPFYQARILWRKMGKHDGTEKQARPTTSFKNFFKYVRVEHALIRAHKQAYKEIKKANPEMKISVVKHVHLFEANWNPINKWRACVMQHLQTYRFLNAIGNHYDEIGLNYYRHTKFGDKKNYLRTDMNWEAYPSGIYGAIMKLGRYQKPIYVAEAGLADDDDDLRTDYLRTQIAAVWRAIQDGAPVKGHTYWSLIDNYELALGYTKRFGLVEVNFETQKRTPRPSAQFYKRICETNTLEY